MSGGRRATAPTGAASEACSAMLTQRHAMQSYGMLRNATKYYATLCNAAAFHAIQIVCNTTHALQCYAMLCDALLHDAV
eukprot:2043882-Pyramimonas_sp.AAC.1